MQEVQKDFWKIIGDWRCIPTNGERNKEGKAIMGAGLAKDAALRLPQFPKILGDKLQEGNHVYYVGNWDYVRYYSFPTKDLWSNPSYPLLLEQSCRELLYLLEKQTEENKKDGRSGPLVILPKVGCGLGGLDYETEVKPTLLSFFDQYNNVIISLGEKK